MAANRKLPLKTNWFEDGENQASIPTENSTSKDEYDEFLDRLFPRTQPKAPEEPVNLDNILFRDSPKGAQSEEASTDTSLPLASTVSTATAAAKTSSSSSSSSQPETKAGADEATPVESRGRPAKANAYKFIKKHSKHLKDEYESDSTVSEHDLSNSESEDFESEESDDESWLPTKKRHRTLSDDEGNTNVIAKKLKISPANTMPSTQAHREESLRRFKAKKLAGRTLGQFDGYKYESRKNHADERPRTQGKFTPK